MRRREAVRRLVGTMLAAAMLGVVGPSCDEARRAFGTPDIRLYVEDTTCGTATVRYGDGSTNDTRLVATLPWSRDIGKPSGLVLVLAATRDCGDDGAVTVEIRLDGRLEQRSSASGPAAVAAASTHFF